VKKSDQKSKNNHSPPSYMATLKLAMPVILLNCTFAVMQATDAWVVGKLGGRELAAITFPSISIFVIVSFAYSFLGIVTAQIGQSHGAGEINKCGHYAWIGIISALLIGILSICLWPAGTLFELFAGSQIDSLGNLESRYFKISLLSLPAVLATNAIANFYIGTKKPSIVLICSIIGVALNITFTYWLVFGNSIIPKLGFNGAAWGTVIATTIEFAFIFLHFCFSKSNRKMKTCRPPKSLKGIKKLWAAGLPAGTQGAVDALSWGVLIGALISYYGEDALASAAILTRLWQFIFLPAEGIAAILIALVANSIGQGALNHAKKHVKICFRINAIFMVSAGLILFLFRYQLVSFFTDQKQIIDIACSSIIFISLSQWFDAMNVTYLHALQGTGDTKWTSKATIILSIIILGGGGAISVIFFKDQGSSVIWALAMAYSIFQGSLFRKRWNSNAWQQLSLRA
jgi:MATE family multidrug resistance protein